MFEHSVEVDPGINPENVKIPHYMVQPFVENAIWHGLLPKEGRKELKIAFSVTDAETVTCTVEDNGVGRKQAGAPKREKRSLALGFIKQRLDVMNKLRKSHYDVVITDRVNGDGAGHGTKVVITIPAISIQDARDNN